ncbi:hypothetical protein D9M68_1008410 [compost metagenome]
MADDDSGEYIRRSVRVAVGVQSIDCLVYEIHPTRIAGRRVIDGCDWIAHAADIAAEARSFSQPKE